MRPAVAVALVIVALVSAGMPAVSFPAAAATCGRADYPNSGSRSDDFVVRKDLWNDLVAAGGFANASAGQDQVSVFVVGPDRNYTVTLLETIVVEYDGGVATNRTTVHLGVRVEARDGTTSERAFTAMSLAGKSGGNLTLAAHLSGDALIVFWRWAYLACDDAFPNSYYVFYSALDGASISADNVLVYFEAPRPRRGPPVDLILLVVAGVAVSVIFLLARHALKRKP